MVGGAIVTAAHAVSAAARGLSHWRRLLKSSLAASLRLHAVRVREVETHGDHEPVERRLLTTEPIESPADVERILDVYRTRWLIEEYFKALETGCAIQQRQLESKHALLNALALFIPIAWRLLRLRTLARGDAEAPATEALTAVQVEVLVATSKKQNKLPPGTDRSSGPSGRRQTRRTHQKRRRARLDGPGAGL